MPGVTRSISNMIKVCLNPTIYLIDSPGTLINYNNIGVMVPHISDPLSSLKVALTGRIFDFIYRWYS